MWQPSLACPRCRSALSLDGDSCCCAGCSARFASEPGLLRLVLPERLASAAPFLEQYRSVRRADGHSVRSAAAYRALPAVSGPDPSGEWAIRRQSLATLLACGALAAGRSSRILDLGAGNGWLSNRLSADGHSPVAVDLNDDRDDGLGAAAAAAHTFPKVQADFDQLPFAPGQFDVVVLNASLHYAPSPSRTLIEANRMIARTGALVVMDSPLFERTRDGEAMVRRQADELRHRYGFVEPLRAGVGFVTLALLRQVAAELGRVSRFFPSRGPLAWRVRRAWSRRRLGRAPAAFGVWVAR